MITQQTVNFILILVVMAFVITFEKLEHRKEMRAMGSVIRKIMDDKCELIKANKEMRKQIKELEKGVKKV